MKQIVAAVLCAVALLAAASGCRAPESVRWDRENFAPHCPYCETEVGMDTSACGYCGKAFLWQSYRFADTAAGAFDKLRWAVKYRNADKLAEVCTSVDGGTIDEIWKGLSPEKRQALLLGSLEHVELWNGRASLVLLYGEHHWSLPARKEADSWKLVLSELSVGP